MNKQCNKEVSSVQEHNKTNFSSRWTVEVIYSDKSSFCLCGASVKSSVQRRKDKRHIKACVEPTIKHPGTKSNLSQQPRDNMVVICVFSRMMKHSFCHCLNIWPK
ncbi:hypothetical protein XENOCAPTIV_012646 [Xenoophorus captivus]|uniref:Uncharacterized protein n=1 Tax=Xenoophorus captivus TaxID=1517983 RepID=A0ABV0QVH9_9TELE